MRLTTIDRKVKRISTLCKICKEKPTKSKYEVCYQCQTNMFPDYKKDLDN